MFMIEFYHLVYELRGCIPTTLTFKNLGQVTAFVSDEIYYVEHDDRFSGETISVDGKGVVCISVLNILMTINYLGGVGGFRKWS
jgi:hypothetical protein